MFKYVMNRKFSVVTTFNQAGYLKYGSRMIDTFLLNWPSEVILYVYAEDCTITQTASNLIVMPLPQELMQFKQQWNSVPKANGDVSLDPVRSKRRDAGKGFKWDAVRFAHKVYAIFDCARKCNSDVLLWMDGDMVCHSAISTVDISMLCPETTDICFLGRRNKYTECGLYAMNLRSRAVEQFLNEFQRCYDQAEQGIFQLEEWHDSYVFDAVRKRFQLVELDWSGDLITGEGHPLINSTWGKYLDHLKGDRKSQGHSKQKDLQITRTEKYWQTLQAS
jgi:hypothetical protein